MAVCAWPVTLGLIMKWYRYVVNIICTLRVACTFNLSYTSLSCNKFAFAYHFPVLYYSNCFGSSVTWDFCDIPKQLVLLSCTVFGKMTDN
jgi:hypothetical protein